MHTGGLKNHISFPNNPCGGCYVGSRFCIANGEIGLVGKKTQSQRKDQKDGHTAVLSTAKMDIQCSIRERAFRSSLRESSWKRSRERNHPETTGTCPVSGRIPDSPASLGIDQI